MAGWEDLIWDGLVCGLGLGFLEDLSLGAGEKDGL